MKGGGSSSGHQARGRKETPAWSKLTASQKEKARNWLCLTPHCRNRVRKKGRSLYCETCRSAAYAGNNQIRIKWLNLKKSEKRRGKSWRLESYPCFECRARIAGYTTFGDRGADALTVNRTPESPDTPYCFSTIEFIPNGENARLSAQLRRASFVPYYQQHSTGQLDVPF